MPTRIQRDDQQSDLLSTIREHQAAMIDLVRSWTDVSHRFTRNLPQPVAGTTVSGFVDGIFDLAEQTLAAQRQLALALAGVATRQTDTALELAGSGTRESLGGVEAVIEAVDREQEPRDREDTEQPQAGDGDAQKGAARKQDGKPDRRAYEERSLDELRDRAGELEIDGRSAMSKDELVTALRNHRQPRAAKGDAPGKGAARKQDGKVDRRPFEERSVEELRDRAGELELEGRSAMGKDELVAALRERSK